MATFTNIPFDILLEICVHIKEQDVDKKTGFYQLKQGTVKSNPLSAFSLLSKRTRDAALPFVFENIAISQNGEADTSIIRLQDRLHAIMASPTLLGVVKSFKLKLRAIEADEESTRVFMVDLAIFLRSLHKLRDLTFKIPESAVPYAIAAFAGGSSNAKLTIQSLRISPKCEFICVYSPNLTQMFLYSPQTNEPGSLAVPQISKCPLLQSLTVKGPVTEALLRGIAAHSPNVTSLTFKRLKKGRVVVQLTGLVQYFSNLPQLETLTLPGVRWLDRAFAFEQAESFWMFDDSYYEYMEIMVEEATEKLVSAFQEQVPHLKHLWFYVDHYERDDNGRLILEPIRPKRFGENDVALGARVTTLFSTEMATFCSLHEDIIIEICKQLPFESEKRRNRPWRRHEYIPYDLYSLSLVNKKIRQHVLPMLFKNSIFYCRRGNSMPLLLLQKWLAEQVKASFLFDVVRSFELNTYLHEDLPQFDDTFVKNMTTFLFSLNNLQTIRYKTPARTNPQTIAYFEQHSRNTPKRELSNVTSLSVSRNNLWLARYCPNLVKLEVLDDLIPDDYGPLNYEDLKGCKQLKRLKLKEKISQEVMDGLVQYAPGAVNLHFKAHKWYAVEGGKILDYVDSFAKLKGIRSLLLPQLNWLDPGYNPVYITCTDDPVLFADEEGEKETTARVLKEFGRKVPQLTHIQFAYDKFERSDGIGFIKVEAEQAINQ